MTITKKEFGALDAAPQILYGKQSGTSDKAYPILVDTAGNLRIASGFAIPPFTSILLTYSSGNLTSVVYVNGAATVGTITLTYSGSTLTGAAFV